MSPVRISNNPKNIMSQFILTVPCVHAKSGRFLSIWHCKLFNKSSFIFHHIAPFDRNPSTFLFSLFYSHKRFFLYKQRILLLSAASWHSGQQTCFISEGLRVWILLRSIGFFCDFYHCWNFTSFSNAKINYFLL